MEYLKDNLEIQNQLVIEQMKRRLDTLEYTKSNFENLKTHVLNLMICNYAHQEQFASVLKGDQSCID